MQRALVAVVALVTTVAIHAPVPAGAVVWTAPERHCHRTGPEVQLTFDDGGPVDNVHTILDTLAAEGVRGGFFPTGDWARANPGLIARVSGEGHWLGNHTGAHTDLAGKPEDVIRHAIASGVPADQLRPPEGSFDDRVRRVAASMGYALCLWTVDPTDWRGRPASHTVEVVCSSMEPGGVAVLHLHARETAAGLRDVIACLRRRGLVLDPLRRHAAADHDGVTRGTVWVAPSGAVVTRDMPHHGQPVPLGAGRRVADVEVVAGGGGYWILGEDGGVHTFGAARFAGSAAGLPLQAPVTAMATTPSGRGYWLVARDGGVFTFGDAVFRGAAAATAAPIVDIHGTRSGAGYWLVAADGGVFSFGDAQFHGSAVDMRAAPIVGIEATGHGGYWLLAWDGAVYGFGDVPFHGAEPSQADAALSMTADPAGYMVVRDDGVRRFGR